MPLTTQNSPLVNGAEFDLKQGQLDDKAEQLRVVRAICIDGKRIEVGDIARDLSASVASELVFAGKLVREPLPVDPPVEKKPEATKPAAKAGASDGQKA